MLKFLALLIFFCSSAFAVESDSIVGVWWSPDQKSKVHIFKQDNRYYGKIIAIRPASKGNLDVKNEDKKLRQNQILGSQILSKFEYKDDRWVEGKIYDPENGKTYKSIMWFNEKDSNTLNIRGYIGFALIGRTAEFKRVQGKTPEKQQVGEPERYYGD